MTGKEILEEEFEKASMRGGYRADQVDVFLQSIATYVDSINEKNKDLTYKIQILADKIEEYKKDEENIRDALLGAQKLGSSILNEAKAKAETMTRESKASSDELLAQAKTKIEFLTKDSLQKANFEINALKKDCEREQKKLESMKNEVSSFRATILKQYKAHIDLLQNLPSADGSNDSFSSEPVMRVQKEAYRDPMTEPPLRPQREYTKSEADLGKEVLEDAAKKVAKQAVAEASAAQQSTQEEIQAENDLKQEIKQEERLQTKEFKRKRVSNISAEEVETHSNVGRAVPYNPPAGNESQPTQSNPQKTNFAEKFGELAFGSNNDKR